MQAELVACRLGRFGRDHDAGAVGELREQRRRRSLQVELHSERIDDVDAVDRADLAAPHAALRGEVADQLVLHRIGIEFFSILELDAVADVDDEVCRILPLVAGGEHRDDVQLGIDVEQLVAQAGEHDAADVGGTEGGIEQIRILTQADMEDAILRRGLHGQ